MVLPWPWEVEKVTSAIYLINLYSVDWYCKCGFQFSVKGSFMIALI